MDLGAGLPVYITVLDMREFDSFAMIISASCMCDNIIPTTKIQLFT